MTATEVLKHEHKVILLVLGAAEKEIESIDKTGKVQAAEIEKMLDFFRNFADRCHHGKEEKQLFERLKEKGLPAEEGPIFVMLKEHGQGRSRLRAVAEALEKARGGDPAAIEIVRDNLERYVDLLRNHIYKEDNVLFVAADEIMSEDDQKELMETFEKVEREEIGEGVHEKYHGLAHELADKYLTTATSRTA